MKYMDFLFSPSDGNKDKQPLFCMLPSGTLYDRPSDSILMKAFSSVSFDTYFNALPLKFVKEELSCSKVRLRIKGSGKVIITLVWATNTLKTGVITSKEVDLSENERFEILFDISCIDKDCLIYPRIDAKSDSVLRSLSYHIDPEPGFAPREVRLGVVVTHYNRQNEVRANLGLLGAFLKRHPEYSDLIKVAVVDNSSNFAFDDPTVTIIKSPNFGGSGGFSRGLLYFQNSWATHVLFMDDDGDYEPESIARLCGIFALAKNPTLAMTGTLLDEYTKTVIEGRGAVFDGCRRFAMSNGFDMASMNDLLEVESYFQKYNYSAWCFFAFRIADAHNYPYPFFVRGDDTLFSIQNGFNARPVIGVGCWIPAFAEKIGPNICYLDIRANLICDFFVDSSVKPILQVLRKFFFRELYKYNYGSAKAILKACQDVFENPDLLFGDFSGKRVREVADEIVKNYRSEKLVDIGLFRPDISRKGVPPKSFIRHLISNLTLNGLLIPAFLCHRHVIHHEIGESWSYTLSYCRRAILYYSKYNNYAYKAVRNPRQGIKLFLEYRQTVKLIKARYKFMSEHYRKIRIDDRFWKDAYGIKD